VWVQAIPAGEIFAIEKGTEAFGGLVGSKLAQESSDQEEKQENQSSSISGVRFIKIRVTGSHGTQAIGRKICWVWLDAGRDNVSRKHKCENIRGQLQTKENIQIGDFTTTVCIASVIGDVFAQRCAIAPALVSMEGFA
jgi:hypothetical protein